MLWFNKRQLHREPGFILCASYRLLLFLTSSQIKRTRRIKRQENLNTWCNPNDGIGEWNHLWAKQWHKIKPGKIAQGGELAEAHLFPSVLTQHTMQSQMQVSMKDRQRYTSGSLGLRHQQSRAARVCWTCIAAGPVTQHSTFGNHPGNITKNLKPPLIH